MRLWLALSLVVAVAASAPRSRDRFWDRFFGRGTFAAAMAASAPAATVYDGGYFEFAPDSGFGMPAVACSGGAMKGITRDGDAGVAIAFLRASAAECYSNDGQTLTQLGNNLPRTSSGDITMTAPKLWVEPLATNLALYSRDLSQAATWVPSSMTCTLTATGMRNDANGASTCTATGASGTVLQTITVAAAQRTTSFHLKRRTGTGAVSVTRNNGTTWTDVSASLSSTVWRRVVPQNTPGCSGGNCIVVAAMTANAANPVIGLKLTTSGDAVDVDFVQDEAGTLSGAFATTPILTTTVSAQRALEKPSFDAAAIGIPVTTFCIKANVLQPRDAVIGTSGAYVCGIVGANVSGWNLNSANGFYRLTTTNGSGHTLQSTPTYLSTWVTVWGKNDGTSSTSFYPGTTTGPTAEAATSSPMSVTTGIGADVAGANQMAGVIGNVYIDADTTRCPP